MQTQSSSIEALNEQLARANSFAAYEHSEVADGLYELRWELRAKIAATPARSIAELQIKAAVLKEEAERDADFECHAPGSARDLALALAADVLCLAA